MIHALRAGVHCSCVRPMKAACGPGRTFYCDSAPRSKEHGPDGNRTRFAVVEKANITLQKKSI